MSHSRIVPASTQSDSDLKAAQADILRASLIPPSTHYLQQLLPSVPAPKPMPADIESIPPARIDTYLGRCISARETVGEAREIDRREVEFVPVELAKAFVRRVEEEAKGLDRQYHTEGHGPNLRAIRGGDANYLSSIYRKNSQREQVQ